MRKGDRDNFSRSNKKQTSPNPLSSEGELNSHVHTVCPPPSFSFPLVLSLSFYLLHTHTHSLLRWKKCASETLEPQTKADWTVTPDDNILKIIINMM